MHAESGLLSWIMEVLAFPSRQPTKNRRVFRERRDSYFVLFLLVSERRERHKRLVRIIFILCGRSFSPSTWSRV